MALSKYHHLFVFVIFSLVFVDLMGAFTQDVVHTNRLVYVAPPTAIDCAVECDRRCKLSSRMNLCKRACGTCCSRCGCVPPKTAGHYEACACYANMTTHGGRRKCP